MRAAVAALVFTVTLSVSAAQWSVAVVGSTESDPRMPAVREAVAHWNEELTALGTSLRLGPVTRSDGPLPDEATLRDISDGTMGGRWFLRMPDLRGYHADVVIFLSCSDLISVGYAPRRSQPGMVILREADDPPLSMPNVARNVIAHELGHVLGLEHNDDSTTLMCGRPAPCRPATFRSNTPRWFPLSEEEKAYLRRRFA